MAEPLDASDASASPARVACVGDSITSGVDKGPTTYPAILQKLLGPAFEVKNFGRSGATLIHDGDLPYGSDPEYAASTAWATEGTDVVIQLGTNDSKPKNWEKGRASFPADCKALVEHYRAGGKNRVWLSTIPPAGFPACCTIDRKTIAKEIVPAIKTCAAETGVPVIDVFAALTPHMDTMADGVHPNERGSTVIAEAVKRAITQRPSITMTTQEEGSSVVLTATPVAAYGTIERVTFREGSKTVGEVTKAPWQVTLHGVKPGAHSYVATAFETAGRSVSATGTMTVAARPAPPPARSGCAVSNAVDAVPTASVLFLFSTLLATGLLRQKLRQKLRR